MSGQTGYYNNMAMCGKPTCTESEIAAYQNKNITPTSFEEQKKTDKTNLTISSVVGLICLGAAIYVANKKGSGFWGYVGYILLGSIVSTAVYKVVESK